MLKPSGGIIVTVAGTVIDALDISNGCIDVQAANVVIKRTRIRSDLGHACSTGALIQDGYNGNLNLTVQDSEIDGLGSQVTGIGNSGLTLLRLNIHGVGAAIHLDGNNSTVQDSWVHDIREVSGSHNDTVYSSGGQHIVIRHNSLENPLGQTSVIILSLWSQAASDWQIDHNLLNGAGYTIYAGQGGTYSATNVRWTNNHFGRKFYPNCGNNGPVVYYDPAGNTWTGNVWDDTGAPVTA